MNAKVQPHQQYDAGFVKAAELDGPSPEELARQQLRKKRLVRALAGIGLIVAIGIGAAAIVWLRRDTPERQYARAVEFAKTNSHRAAIIELKRSLQTFPDQPQARVLLGQEFTSIGEASAAEIEFRKALDARYQPERTMPLLATSLIHQAKFNEVISLINDTNVDSAEANAELLAMRGSAYFALGREAEANASWKAANEFAPNHPATLMAQARALASKGSYAEAEKITQGITTATPSAEFIALRGDLARASGRQDDAIAAYRLALESEPGNLTVRTNLAQALVEQNRFDEATVQAKKVLATKPNFGLAHFVVAVAAIGKKDFVAADDAASKAVLVEPGDGRFQLVAGTLALQVGHTNEAEIHLKDAVQLMPQNADARRLLAMIYMQRHEVKKADDLFYPVFNAARDQQEIALIAARIALRQGDGKKAAKAFDGVDPADPRNVEGTLLAASLQMRSGDKAGGFEKLRAASRAAPANADIDAALVISHLTFNETKEAAASWAVLSKKEPTAARTFNLEAAIDLAQGSKAKARIALEKAAAADPHFLAPVAGLAMLDIGEKKPEPAKERLQQFIAANPTSLDAAFLFANLEQKTTKRPDVILQTLQNARAANPASAQVVTALVTFYMQQGDAKKAVQVAEDGLKLAPSDVGLLQFVGNQAIESGDGERAITAFTQLANEDTSTSLYPLRLGQGYLIAGKPEGALSSFRTALSRQSNNVDLQYAMIGSLISYGRTDEAGRMWFEITRMAPKSPAIPELDADVKLGKKQYPEAIAAYRRALAATPSSRLAIKTAQALTMARLRGEAGTVLSDWLKARPADDQVRAFDADLAMRNKDYPRAAGAFRTLAANHPKDALILNNLAYSLARLDDPQALPTAEKASALAPDNPSVTDTLAWLLVENGQAPRGLTLLEKASNAAPNEHEIRLHLAKAQLKVGQTDAARATLQRVIAATPESVEGRQAKELIATF